MSTAAPIAFDPPPQGSRPGLGEAIDFVNTTGLTKGRPFEDLASSDAAIHWLLEAGYLLPEPAAAESGRLAADPRRAEAAMRRLRLVRSGLRELIDALAEQRAPDGSAVEAVNGALALPETAQLVLAGDRVRLVARREGNHFDQALAVIARAIADEVSHGHPDRLRICENDRCRWAFYDRSRPGTRRWCEMASCGNRMKAARHRARQRAEGGIPAS